MRQRSRQLQPGSSTEVSRRTFLANHAIEPLKLCRGLESKRIRIARPPDLIGPEPFHSRRVHAPLKGHRLNAHQGTHQIWQRSSLATPPHQREALVARGPTLDPNHPTWGEILERCHPVPISY